MKQVSNLNRQFLFRKDNVGMAKSVCAAAAASKMNPQMHINCFETPVGKQHFIISFIVIVDKYICF
jgi:ubiquitin-activating enzyme E1